LENIVQLNPRIKDETVSKLVQLADSLPKES